MRYIYTPIVMLLIACMLPLVSSAASADTKEVLVIGDSLTARASDKLADLDSSLTVDGVRGRPVTHLPKVLAEHVKKSGHPDVLVIALGTNYRSGWTKQSYRNVILSLPETTDVIFVTTYRSAKVFGKKKARQQTRVSRWMRELSAEYAQVEYTGWRWQAKQDRKRPKRLRVICYDGVHQTGGREAPRGIGEDVWTQTIRKGLEKAA